MWDLNYEPLLSQERQERRRKLIVFTSVLALGAAEALAVDFKMKAAGAINSDIRSRSLTNQTGTLSTPMSVCDNCEIEVKGAGAIQAQGNLRSGIQDVKLSVQN